MKSENEVKQAYRQTASGYDSSVNTFNLFSRFGFDIPTWRMEAVQKLALQPGATVVDIGCGTGLNFPLLQEAIGPTGKIIGVDLSAEMLDEARQLVAQNGWDNVELVCADATQFEFPSNLDGVLSTFALILIPDCDQVVKNGYAALASGRRLVVLDMAWPRWMPVWWRHVLFFLKSYGVTGDTIRRQPWNDVWRMMERGLTHTSRKQFWMGFFYLAAGEKV